MERFGTMPEAVCSVFERFVREIGYNINYSVSLNEEKQGGWESMEVNEVQSKIYDCRRAGSQEVEKLNIVVFRLPSGEYEVTSYLMK